MRLDRRTKLELQLTGIKEIDRKLKRIVEKEAKKISRNALRAGARVGAKDLKNSVPTGKTKKLRKAVGSSFRKDRKAGVPVAKWGINVGKKRSQMARHGASVAAGTRDRTQKKTGKDTGAIKNPPPFVADSAKRSRMAVMAAVGKKAREGFKRIK